MRCNRWKQAAGILNIKITPDDDRAMRRAFEVADTGNGISTRKRLSSIFEPYLSTKGDRYRDWASRSCQKVVEIHNGTIDVESERR